MDKGPAIHYKMPGCENPNYCTPYGHRKTTLLFPSTPPPLSLSLGSLCFLLPIIPILSYLHLRT